MSGPGRCFCAFHIIFHLTHEFNPLSPRIPIQTLQTDLHTFPARISLENLIADQSFFHQVIILLILTTFSFDYVLILFGEN